MRMVPERLSTASSANFSPPAIEPLYKGSAHADREALLSSQSIHSCNSWPGEPVRDSREAVVVVAEGHLLKCLCHSPQLYLKQKEKPLQHSSHPVSASAQPTLTKFVLYRKN